VLRETDPQLDLWEALLPEHARRLPDELARIDAFLDDEAFVAPWRQLFAARLGRPSVPVDTLLRLLYLKHRYQLGYETLCREVNDSITWRRFCRLGLDRPVPHPTTLIKLVGRAGPETVTQLNTALLGKLAAGKVLRGRKLRIDTTVVEADIDYPTDADLLVRAVGKLGGLVGRIKARGAAARTPFRDRRRAAGRRLRQLSQTLRRRTGDAIAEVTRFTAELAGIAGRTLGDASPSPATPAGRLPGVQATAGCGGWWPTWTTRSPTPAGCWTRPPSGWPGCAASRIGWCRWPTRTPGRSARASRSTRPRSAKQS
jgi:IS5 family transposase